MFCLLKVLVLVLLGDVLLPAVTCDIFFCMDVHHKKGILVLSCSLWQGEPKRKSTVPLVF